MAEILSVTRQRIFSSKWKTDVDNNLLSVGSEFWGFYEMDAKGIVLYAYLKHKTKLEKSSDLSPVKRDFFVDIFNYYNADDLRRHFFGFVASKLTTETFMFRATMPDKIILFNITFIRVLRVDDNKLEAVYFLDIKPTQSI